ncbi:unnamed protein product [Amaranthus hypochondriacus]
MIWLVELEWNHKFLFISEGISKVVAMTIRTTISCKDHVTDLSLFPTPASLLQDHDSYSAVLPQQPVMSATALLQKATEMDAAATSGSSWFCGFDLISQDQNTDYSTVKLDNQGTVPSTYFGSKFRCFGAQYLQWKFVVLLLLSWGFVAAIVVFSLVPSCVVAVVAFSLVLSYDVAVTMVCEGVWLFSCFRLLLLLCVVVSLFG